MTTNTTATVAPATARPVFIDTDCERSGSCRCGFCKWVVIGATEIVRSCDRGDCKATATTTCPRFGYPVCARHKHANCHNHRKGQPCTTKRIPA